VEYWTYLSEVTTPQTGRRRRNGDGRLLPRAARTPRRSERATTSNPLTRMQTSQRLDSTISSNVQWRELRISIAQVLQLLTQSSHASNRRY